MGELTVFITCVSSAGSQLRVFAQLNPDEYAALDSSISIVQSLLDSSVLSTPFGVQSGEMVMVRSGTTSSVRWLRARVLDVSDTEHGRLTVQYIDYGSKESVYFTHVCSGRLPVLNNILCQPPLAKEFLLADVIPVDAVWSDAALRFVESVVMGQMVQALLLPTSTDGLMQIRVLVPPDNAVSVAEQMCKLSLAQPAPAYQPTPVSPALYQSAPPSFPPANPAHTTFRPTAPAFQPATVAPPVFQAYYQQPAPAFTPRALQTPTLTTTATRWQQPAAAAPAVGEQLAMRVRDIASQPPQHGMQLQVTICHYTDSPAKFSIRSQQREPELRQLLAELQQYCQQVPAQPVPCVEPGGVCLSTSQQSHAPQGQFLRAVITQVDNNIVKVYWVDHGFDELRYVSELRAMPLRFARTAILAHRVALAGLSAYSPAGAGPQQLFRDITAGRQLTCRYQSKEHPNHVELLDSGVSVLELLVRHGVYVPRQSSSAPAVRPPGFSASQQLTSSVIDQLTPGAVLDVLVVSVSAIDNVYVRPASHQMAVEQLHMQMLTALSSPSAVPLTVDMAKPGTVCAVRKGSVFRRAQLVSAGRREVKVLLMDVGTSEMIPISSALMLDEKFSLVPPQVVCCFLSGLETQHGTADQVRFLESLVQASPRLSCRVVSVRAGKPVLQLTDVSRSAPRDINALLRDHIATTAGPATSTTGSPSVSPTALSAVVNSPKVELGSVESIVVMHVESASQFFGQLASFDADDLYNMEEAMQKLYGTGRARPLSTATVGTFCVSQYSDTYYRAKVVAKTDDRVTVEYVDYGNRETKSLSEIYPLSSNFTKLPQLGVFCSLIGGSSLPVDGFRDIVMDQTVDVMLHSLLCDKYRVLLPPSGTNNATVLAQLKRIGYVPKVMGDSSSSSTCSSVKPSSSATKPAVSSTPLATGTLPQQSVPLGVYKDAEIVHVVDPGEFYLQLKEQFDCIDQLQEQLAAEYETSLCRVTAAAAVGQLVAARHSSDGGWYRGRVLGTDKQQQVSVFFVDYGDTQSLSVSELCPLLAQHATLPAQAIRCCVDSKPADGKRWTDAEVSKFSGDVLEQRMLVCVDEVQRGGTSLVTLAQAHNIKPGSVTSRRSPQRQESRADQDLNWREGKSKSPVEARHESSALRRPSDPVVSNGDAGFQGRMRMDHPSEFAPTPRTPSAVSAACGDGGSWGRAEESQSAADGRGQQENRPVRAAVADSWGQQNSGGDRRSVRDDSGFTGRSDSRTVKRQDSNPSSWAQSGGGNTNGGDRRSDRTASGASSAGRGQGGSSGSWASKPAATAASVEIAAHSGTIQLRTLSPGSRVKTTPTWVSGLADFYLHPLVDDQHPFCQMMQQLQLFYSGLQLPADARETNVQLGKAVVARGTDGVWYRGLVQKLDGEKVGVLFPDYGTRMMEEKSKLKRIKPEFCQMPAHAYRCRFADVEPAGGTWRKMDKPSLSKYFCEEVQMVSVSVDDKYTYVDVICNGKSSRDQIVADGLAVKAGQKLQLKEIGAFVGLDTLFRVAAELSVYVAYISSTDCFYVQLNDNVDQLTKLETDIETFTNDCKEGCSMVSAGEICLAPFEEVYYRSVISRVNGDHASVYFIDYGNTEQVAVADLLECPISLVDVPAQAVPCRLTGVAADKTQQFRDLATEQELKAVIDAVFDTYLEVTLLDGLSEINKQLGGNGKISASATATSTLATAPPALATAPSASATAPSASATATSTLATAPSALATAPSASATAPSASATAPSASATAPSAWATAPSTLATGDECSIVVVCYSVDPGEFYVQFADAAATQRLDDVMDQLEQYYTQLTGAQGAVDKVEVGAVVAAPYSEDGGVYRACVTAVNCADDPDSCQLYFIDYGNSESVPRDQLRQLPAQLLAPAAMSQPCRLAVQPVTGKLWDKAAVDSFQQLVGDGQLQLMRLNSCGDVWTVELRDPACKNHVAEELIKQGHAQPDIVQPKQQECVETGLSTLSVGSLVDAAVVYSLSPTDFWVQLNADSSTLDVLMERLSTAELLAVTDTPTAGQLLVARYSEDGALYRARVVSVDGGVSVLFMDYGNQELVTRDALYVCPEQLAVTPPLALHCRLPLQATQGWSDEALETFNQLTGQEQLLRLELLEAPQDGVTCRVNLYDGQTDVAFSLVGAGYGQPESAADVTTETPAAAADVTTETTTTAAHVFTETSAAAADVTTETLTAAAHVTTETTDAGDESVFVSHVNSPWDLYVQSADSDALDSLMERLSTEDLPALADPAAVGQLVAAVYSLDGAIYRARVEQLTADGAVQLLYVDYGNGEETASDGLLQLPEELVAVPWQARRCRLAVEPLSDDHTAATDRLRQAVCDTEEPLAMRRLPGGAGDVTLVSLMTSDGRDAAALLVAAGVCRRAVAAVTCLPPSLPVPAGQSTELLVAHIESPGHFYVQLRRDTAALDELMEQLETAAGQLQPLRAPAPGQLCVARYPDDQAWYRGRVLDVTGETARLQFVDYGNCSELPTAELLAPPSELLLLPELSRRCRLPARPRSPATSWDAGATAAFAEISTRADNTYTVCLLPDEQTDGGSVAPLQIQGRSVVQLLQEAGVQLVSEEQLHKLPSRRASAEDKIVPGHISYKLLEDQEEEDSSVYESALHSPADDSSPVLQACVSPDDNAVAAAIYCTDQRTCTATYNKVEPLARSMSASPRPGSGRTSPEDKVVPGLITHGLIVLPGTDTEDIVIAATDEVVEQGVSAETTDCSVEEHGTKENYDGLAENAASEAVEEGEVFGEMVEEVDRHVVSEEIDDATVSLKDSVDNVLRRAPKTDDAPGTDMTADVTAGAVCDESVEEVAEAEVNCAAAVEERLAETAGVDGVPGNTTGASEVRKSSVDTDIATSDEDSGSERDGEGADVAVVGSDRVQDESAGVDVCDASSSSRGETLLKEAAPVMPESEREVSGNDDVDDAGDQDNGTRSLVEDNAARQQVISVSTDVAEVEAAVEGAAVQTDEREDVCDIEVSKTNESMLASVLKSDAEVIDECNVKVAEKVNVEVAEKVNVEVAEKVNVEVTDKSDVADVATVPAVCDVSDEETAGVVTCCSDAVSSATVKDSCDVTESCEAGGDAVKDSCHGTVPCEVGGDVVKDSCDGSGSCEFVGDATVNGHMSTTT